MLLWAEFDIRHRLEEISRFVWRYFLLLNYAQQVFLFRRLHTLLHRWLARSAKIEPKVRIRLLRNLLLAREVKLACRTSRRIKVEVILALRLLCRRH